MYKKYLGFALILFALVAAGIVYSVKVREDRLITELIANQGSCYLSDGTCLHEDRTYTPYIVGGALSLALLLFGFYLVIDKSDQVLIDQQRHITSALKEAKKLEKERDEFSAFLLGFSLDEQKILRAIHEEEGIEQSTLRFKTNLSKATLSLLLKSLEDRNFISRKPKGKTNQVFLVKK